MLLCCLTLRWNFLSLNVPLSPTNLEIDSLNVLFTTSSRTALGRTQPPIQWVPGALSLRVKRPGREADHSPPSSAEVKEWVELYLHSPIRFHGVVLSWNTGTTLPVPLLFKFKDLKFKQKEATAGFQTHRAYSFKININIILPFMPGFHSCHHFALRKDNVKMNF
jgi:hypothetical protein